MLEMITVHRKEILKRPWLKWIIERLLVIGYCSWLLVQGLRDPQRMLEQLTVNRRHHDPLRDEIEQEYIQDDPMHTMLDRVQ